MGDLPHFSNKGTKARLCVRGDWSVFYARWGNPLPKLLQIFLRFFLVVLDFFKLILQMEQETKLNAFILLIICSLTYFANYFIIKL